MTIRSAMAAICSGVLPGPKMTSGKPCGPAVVVDPGEPEVLERGLAQKLKEALVRSLRCSGPRAAPVEEGPEFVTRHAGERLSRASKCLVCVDFRFCRAIKSPIVPRDGFIFL